MTDPYNFLHDLENRTIKSSVEVPVLDQVEQNWVGVGFRVGAAKLITSMSDVKEILDLPQVTNVPGVKSWVVGIANVRGSLLPIMDLKGYLTGEDIKKRKTGRVIVIDYKGINTGLVVEEIFGMRHFRKADVTSGVPDVDKNLSPYIDHAYKDEDEYWPVFDFNKLTRDERFSQASI